MSADAIADTEAGTSPTRETIARLMRHRSFVIGGAFMLAIAIIARESTFERAVAAQTSVEPLDQSVLASR